MSRRATTWLAYFAFALSLACYSISLAFSEQMAVNNQGMQFVDPIDLSMLAYAAVGVLVAARRPANAIGWIFGIMGLMWEVWALARAYAGYVALSAPGSLAALLGVLWLPLHLWITWFGLLLFLFLLFPNGQLLSSRWRPVIWLTGVLVASLLLTSTTSFKVGSTRLSFPSLLELLRIDTEGRVVGAVPDAAISILAAVLVAAAAALLLRAHRARADERQQLKWFIYASMLCIFILVAERVLFDFLHALDPTAKHDSELFGEIPSALAVAAIPIGAGIAILKYRLYEIDIIIRRTLIYTVLTASLAFVYFGSVVLLQQLFRALTGQSSELAIIVSTLGIAALFVPLRQRVQNVIDHRFYRSKYDAQKVLAEFAATARDEVDLQRVTERLLDVVDETMQPAHVSLWLRPTEREVKR